MHRNIKSLYCVRGINGAIDQLHIKNKLTEKEIRFVVTRAGGWRRQNWIKVVKRYKLPVILGM